MHRAPTVALALLCACTVGPDFHAPSVTAPGVWGTVRTDVPGQTTSGEVQADWWQAFNDPTLTSLVQRLFTSNIDLQTAAERILQGRAQRRVTASEALPQLNGESSYRRIRVSKTGIPSLFTPAPGAPLEYNDFHNALSASWDLDLFGVSIRQGPRC